jgi:hypothetical protein
VTEVISIGGEPYEQLRDSASGEAGVAWQAADKENERLRNLYQSLQEDERYTLEHKSAVAWEAFEDAREKIASNAAKAKAALEQQAKAAERLALPFPDGEGPRTSDKEKLLLSQGESLRVIRKIDRLISQEGPFKHNLPAVLKQEYERGLEVGGALGGAICRGVLSAADELSIDPDSVVDDFRKERHRESLERAERSLFLANHVSNSVPEPPFKRPTDIGPSLSVASPTNGATKWQGQFVRSSRHW